MIQKVLPCLYQRKCWIWLWAFVNESMSICCEVSVYLYAFYRPPILMLIIEHIFLSRVCSLSWNMEQSTLKLSLVYCRPFFILFLVLQLILSVQIKFEVPFLKVLWHLVFQVSTMDCIFEHILIESILWWFCDLHPYLWM